MSMKYDFKCPVCGRSMEYHETKIAKDYVCEACGIGGSADDGEKGEVTVFSKKSAASAKCIEEGSRYSIKAGVTVYDLDYDCVYPIDHKPTAYELFDIAAKVCLDCDTLEEDIDNLVSERLDKAVNIKR